MTGLRARKKLRTRDDIAEAALTLFEQRGFEETTIEAIADAAQVSPRTVFRYFTSKEDLLFLGQDAENQRIAAIMANRPVHADLITSFMEGVRTVLFGPEAAPRPQVLRAQKLLTRLPTLQHLQAKVVKDIEQQLARQLTPPGTSKKEGAQRELFSAVAMAALEVTMRRWLAAGGRGVPEDELDELEAMLRRAFPGLGAPPRRAKR